MRIRPCIDIHNGRVKQIVGGTLRDGNVGGPDKECLDQKKPAFEAEEKSGRAQNSGESSAEENFVSQQSADYFAGIYREKKLPGGHIILLNSKAADPEMYEADVRQAFRGLAAYPGGMQIGGGITPENAGQFLDAGASHVIVTSYVFRDGELNPERLEEMERTVGKDRLVLDLSCRRRGNAYYVVTDRWQKWTELEVNPDTLEELSEHCDEFLIHAADVEGQRKGIERNLVRILGGWLEKHAASGSRTGSGEEKYFPVTYAGGVHSLEDLAVMKRESDGLLDVTVGSALDLFGGTLSLNALAQTVE